MAFRFVDWDPDELREMRLVRKMSYPAIGRELGVHHTSVMARCWLYGIEERPVPKPRKRVLPDFASDVTPDEMADDRRCDAPDDTPELARLEQGLKLRMEERPFPRETDDQAWWWQHLLQADAEERRVLGLPAGGFVPALRPRRKLPSILTEQPRARLQAPDGIEQRAVNDDARRVEIETREARLARK